MDSSEEHKTLSCRKNIPKSAIGFPNSTTYVVAFALKETYDDLVTAQQMICNKRSPQESTNSITPTNSLKKFDSIQAEKNFEILDAPENSVKEKQENVEISESKNIELINYNFKITDSQREIVFLNDTDEPTEVLHEVIKHNYVNLNQPEVIFNGINYGRRCKDIKFLRKSKNYKNIKPKFKCKSKKKSSSTHFEKYCAKAKRNSVNSEQIQKRFSNISTVVSRTTVLRKESAKENLLEETEMISILNNALDEYEDGALFSHPITSNIMSFVSNSSGKTLTQKSSTTSSKNEDGQSIHTVKSAYELISEAAAPFKTDINVSVAVTYKQSYVLNKDEMSESNKEDLKHRRSLTSSDEMFIVNMAPLTSKIASGVINKTKVDKVDSMKMSDATLVNNTSSFGADSDDDTYDMARTSSDFNESNNDSTYTLKNNPDEDENESEVIGTSENSVVEDRSEMKKPNLFETVINLGQYPEVSASTSSDVTFDFEHNDVIITKHTILDCVENNKNKGDIYSAEKVATNILKKQFIQRDVTPNSKYLNLPSEAHIKSILDEKEKQQFKRNKDSILYPSNITEMWDRLIIVLDTAFKTLGEAITGKIVNELKKSIAALELHLKSMPGHDLDLEKGDIIVIEPPVFKEAGSTQRLKEEVDKCLQCDLVQNKIIDQIMMKISSQGPKIIEPALSVKSLQKLKRPKLLKDYVEVLKPVETTQELDKTETVTFSKITIESVRFDRLRTFFFGPIKFLKENLFVVTSVPVFFVVLLFLYGLILLLMKPW